MDVERARIRRLLREVLLGGLPQYCPVEGVLDALTDLVLDERRRAANEAIKMTLAGATD